MTRQERQDENGDNGRLDSFGSRHRVLLEVIRTSSGVINVILALIILLLNVYNIWYK